MSERIPECGNSSKDYDCERPLKKARYMWQLKGKYYLKNEYKRCTSNVGTSKTYHNQKNDDFNTNNIDRSKFNKSSTSKCKLINSSNVRTSGNESVDEIPPSMVRNDGDNDDYLHKWQTKRIAQSFIDNTINMILENWKISPFDATDLVENCANGGQVEDEGILMAIQSHGLQSNNRGNMNSVGNTSNNLIQCQDNSRVFTTPTEIIETRMNQNTGTNTTFLFQSTMDNYTNTQNETMQSVVDSECIYDEPDPDCNDFKTDDSMDFLRTAVSVAIEKKGLSYTY